MLRKYYAYSISYRGFSVEVFRQGKTWRAAWCDHIGTSGVLGFPGWPLAKEAEQRAQIEIGDFCQREAEHAVEVLMEVES